MTNKPKFDERVIRHMMDSVAYDEARKARYNAEPVGGYKTPHQVNQEREQAGIAANVAFTEQWLRR